MNIQQQLSEFFSVWKEIDALYSNFAKASGISDTAFWILYCVRQTPENITQKSICKQLSLSKQTVNSALLELVKKHIIMLSENESDRRSKSISLTVDGKRFAEKYLDIISKIEQETFGELSQSERETMIGSSKKYLELFKSATAEIFDNEGNI